MDRRKLESLSADELLALAKTKDKFIENLRDRPILAKSVEHLENFGTILCITVEPDEYDKVKLKKRPKINDDQDGDINE